MEGWMEEQKKWKGSGRKAEGGNREKGMRKLAHIREKCGGVDAYVIIFLCGQSSNSIHVKTFWSDEDILAGAHKFKDQGFRVRIKVRIKVVGQAFSCDDQGQGKGLENAMCQCVSSQVQ